MKKLHLLALGLLASSQIVFAADMKFAFVNIERLYEAAPAKSIKSALDTKFKPRGTELKNLETAITKEQPIIQALSAKTPDFNKLPAADQEKVKKFQKNYADFQQKSVLLQQDAGQAQNTASAMLMVKINQILKDISDKQGYDLVLTSNQLVYAKAKYDITDQVMVELNKIKVPDIIEKINSGKSISNNTLAPK